MLPNTANVFRKRLIVEVRVAVAQGHEVRVRAIVLCHRPIVGDGWVKLK